MLAGTESSSNDTISNVSFFRERQEISGEAGAGLTISGRGLSVTCDFPTGGEVSVIAGDGAIVPIGDSVDVVEGDTLVGKSKPVGLGCTDGDVLTVGREDGCDG